MNYTMNDVLTIQQQDYIVAATFLEKEKQYFLLVALDKDEEINLNDIKVMSQPLVDNLKPNLLNPVLDEKELQRVYPILLKIMQEE